ncbi:hypothetical protein Tco_0489021 [Tanacetum coccineum]
MSIPSLRPCMCAKDTSSSSIDYIPKSPTSSTSPSPNGYLNPSTSPPPRVSPPPPTQDNASMDITLTLSPNTPLDVQFDTPSPSPPIIAHPIPWNFLEAHVKSSDGNSSSSDIAKLTHAVNQQTSAVTTAMTAILKQLQATPPPASVKAVEEICLTCGGAHPYYQCLAADGNTFPEYRDNIQGYVAAAACNYNQGNSGYRPPGVANQTRPSGFVQQNSNTIANPKGELKAITTRSGLVLDGPTVPIPPPFINPEEDERVEETLTDPKPGEFTIKVPPPLVQKSKPHSQRNYVVHQRDLRHPHILYPSRMHQEKRQKKDEVQIYKFWQIFKQLHINIYLADALILIPKYQKMLKSLLSNKEKLLELANTPLNENCSAVILKKLPEKLGDPGKFLILCGFSELKCKALADLGIARDVFVPVGKFTFPANFVLVDYESDPRVPLISGRPFLRTACALIEVHGEEMILCDGNERLTLNMRHDTSSYSTQPHQESINMIDVYNVSHEEILEDLFAKNHPSGNPTSSLTSHTDLTSPKVINQLSGNPTPISEPVTKSSSSSPTLISIEESDLIWEEFKAYLASDSFPPRNSNPSSPLPPFHNYLSDSTTSSSPSLPISKTSDYFLEEFNLLNHDPIKEMDFTLEDSVDENSLDNNLDDTISEMFTDEHALDYSSPPLWDDYDDELFDLETVNDNTYDDPFDSKEEKIKESKLLIDELDPPRSSDFLPFPECDLVFYVDFSEVDDLSSTNNEDKVFNLGILIHENLYEVTNLATMEKNVKKPTNASLILEDFNPLLYELPFHKEVPGLRALL